MAKRKAGRRSIVVVLLQEQTHETAQRLSGKYMGVDICVLLFRVFRNASTLSEADGAVFKRARNLLMILGAGNRSQGLKTICNSRSFKLLYC